MENIQKLHKISKEVKRVFVPKIMKSFKSDLMNRRKSCPTKLFLTIEHQTQIHKHTNNNNHVIYAQLFDNISQMFQ